MIWLDAARLAVGASALTFVAWADLRWRRAPDAAWLLVGGAGVVLLLLELALDADRVTGSLPALAIAGVIGILFFAAWWLGLLVGAADAKALVAFSVLGALPVHSDFGVPLPGPFPLVLSALGNALVFVPLIPLGLVVWNLLHRDAALPVALLGYRRAVAGLDDSHVWPLEWVDAQGRSHRAATPGRVPHEGSRERDLRAAGLERVWVTPKIPFLVPFAFGFPAAFLVGDVLAWLVERVLG